MNLFASVLLSAPLLLAQSTPPSWAVVFSDGTTTRAVRLADDRIDAAEPFAPPLPLLEVLRPEGKATSEFGTVVPSPDGKRLAGLLRLRAMAHAHGIYVVADADGDRVRGLGQLPGAAAAPIWFPDGERLLLPRRAAGEPTRAGTELIVHDLRTDSVTPFGDQEISLTPTPLFLVDGHLLHLRRRPVVVDGKITVALDLATTDADHADRPDRRKVLVPDVGPLQRLFAAPNGQRFWLVGLDRIRCVDRQSRVVDGDWPIASLARPTWTVRLGEVVMRPDGEALAMTFWPTGPRGPGEQLPGDDTLAVLDRTATAPQVTWHPVAPRPRLLGFRAADRPPPTAK